MARPAPNPPPYGYDDDSDDEMEVTPEPRQAITPQPGSQAGRAGAASPPSRDIDRDERMGAGSARKQPDGPEARPPELPGEAARRRAAPEPQRDTPEPPDPEPWPAMPEAAGDRPAYAEDAADEQEMPLAPPPAAVAPATAAPAESAAAAHPVAPGMGIGFIVKLVVMALVAAGLSAAVVLLLL